MEASPDGASSNPELGFVEGEQLPEQQQSTADQEEKQYKMSNDEAAEDSKIDNAAKDTPSDKASSSGKIFIGGLSWETTSEKLTDHFKKYGEIIDSVIMKDRTTGHHRGFGFVTYSDPSVCDRVMQDKHILDGRTVEIKKSIPRENMAKGPKTKKIFVGGIPTSLTKEEFKSFFSTFGKVVEHQIMQDQGGRSRGFGFITFDSEQVVDNVLSQGKMIELGGKQVEIKKAEPKQDMPERRSKYGSRSGRENYGPGPLDAGGYGDYGPYDGAYAGPYRSGSGAYGPRVGGYASEGYAGYGHGYGGSGYAGLGGIYGSSMSYDGLGGGYGGTMMGGYGDFDGYGAMPYGGYGSSSSYRGAGSGGAYSGGYGSSRYGSNRYHPYGKN